MSSTDASVQHLAIQKLFQEKILPLAGQIRESGKGFFQTHPDPQQESYYVQRPQTQTSFEPIGCEIEEELAGALERLWKSQGYPELAPLAKEFAKLAAAYRSTEEQTDEVSPFIYVMF